MRGGQSANRQLQQEAVPHGRAVLRASNGRSNTSGDRQGVQRFLKTNNFHSAEDFSFCVFANSWQILNPISEGGGGGAVRLSSFQVLRFTFNSGNNKNAPPIFLSFFTLMGFLPETLGAVIALPHLSRKRQLSRECNTGCSSKKERRNPVIPPRPRSFSHTGKEISATILACSHCLNTLYNVG